MPPASCSAAFSVQIFHTRPGSCAMDRARSASADAYLAMHSARLASFGITGIRARQFEVNEALTRLTRGPAA
jgi:hypothetical protein